MNEHRDSRTAVPHKGETKADELLSDFGAGAQRHSPSSDELLFPEWVSPKDEAAFTDL